MDPAPEVYRPYTQIPSFAPDELVLRTQGDPLKAVNAARQAIWSVDRDQAVADVRTMAQVRSESISRQRFNMLLLALFAAVALTLAPVGLYGVISYAVEQSTREIGVRVALGAQTKDVMRLVIGQGLALTLAGVALGVAAAFGVTRLMTNLLFGVTATDPAVFLAAPVILALVAVIACYIPARRAANVDPMIALRQE
jgi:putative ABC transport system permease protein